MKALIIKNERSIDKMLADAATNTNKSFRNLNNLRKVAKLSAEKREAR